jgi:hypothetical protein
MMSSFGIKMSGTCQLHNSDMKKLVPIFRGVPSPGSDRLDAYNNTVKECVKALPHWLRKPYLSSSSNLCRTHKGLNSLINEVWSWVQHEFDSGIGKYVFPVLMNCKLNPGQENKIRQLEPVLEMWRKDFKTEASAPPGRPPIPGHAKWAYQTDQCSACMLARVGSDNNVLLALYAGMIGRFPLHKLMGRTVSLAELRASKLNDPKSKRVRFVRYWIKACRDGDNLMHDAAELGIALKKMHKEWKRGRKESPSIYGGRSDSERASSGGDPFSDDNCVSTSGSGRPHTPPRHSVRQHSKIASDIEPKIGPSPRSSDITSRSPVKPLGFNLSAARARDSLLPQPDNSDSDSTIYPGDSISVAPLGITKPLPHLPNRYADMPPSNPFLDVPYAQLNPRPVSSVYSTHPSQVSGSFASTATILSYDGCEAATMMPKRQSMYFWYGDKTGDPFEDADEDEEGKEPMTPIVEEEVRG